MPIHFDKFTAESALLAIRWLLLISLTIASIQNIFHSAAYSSRGLLSWKILKYAYEEKLFQKNLFDTIFNRTGYILLNLVRVALMTTAAVSPASPLVMIGLFAANGALFCRSYLAMSAADQLNTILLFYLLLYACFPSPAFLTITLCFIAVQSIFCYFCNGVVKALEPGWLDGSHLKRIFLTGSYSRNAVAALAGKTGLEIFRLLSYGVILWELGAVVTPFLPAGALWVWLGIGLLFHLTVAVVMGLNTFFWTFLCTYPAILFLQEATDNWPR